MQRRYAEVISRSSAPTLHRRTLLASSALALAGAGVGCGGAAAAPASVPAPPPPAPPRTPPPELALPARAPSAPGARVLVDELAGLGAGDRERRVAEELLAGNVPRFVRRLVPVPLDASRIGAREAIAHVTPDYLCLGSDDDFVRIATTWKTARKVAALAGAVFPTRMLVDAIYAHAPYKITSPRMNAGAGRPEDVLAHHDIIEGRRKKAGAELGALIAGCKKDLVLTRRMLEKPGHTAIYGWFLKDGSVVQSLSLVHDDRFLDYVQGTRLVARHLHVDGREVDILDALADRELAPLLSDEGSFDLRVAWERGW